MHFTFTVYDIMLWRYDFTNLHHLGDILEKKMSIICEILMFEVKFHVGKFILSYI